MEYESLYLGTYIRNGIIAIFNTIKMELVFSGEKVLRSVTFYRLDKGRITKWPIFKSIALLCFAFHIIAFVFLMSGKFIEFACSFRFFCFESFSIEQKKNRKKRRRNIVIVSQLFVC